MEYKAGTLSEALSQLWADITEPVVAFLNWKYSRLVIVLLGITLIAVICHDMAG